MTVTLARGVIFTLDGVGGFNIATSAMALAFKLAGLPHRIEQLYWSHGFGRWLVDLQDKDRLEEKARELAGKVSICCQAGMDVYIVAKSAGCAIALKALTMLPQESVRKVVLLAPAVSPDYKLAPALRAVKEKIFAFWSPLDGFILGFGTMVFGTADGAHRLSAGMVGFNKPHSSSNEIYDLYEKLQQIRWEPEMLLSLNFGDHQGSVTVPFLQSYVVPLLK